MDASNVDTDVLPLDPNTTEMNREIVVGSAMLRDIRAFQSLSFFLHTWFLPTFFLLKELSLIRDTSIVHVLTKQQQSYQNACHACVYI